MLRLDLPYPPSLNHYFRSFRGRIVISRTGRMFRQTVCTLLRRAGIRPAAGPLAVAIDLYPPDRRVRDCDNALKALIDALQHGGAFFDDSQIVWLLTVRAQVVVGGKSIVTIGRLGQEQLPSAAAWMPSEN
jgi:crossover junction endodeoxyribonuclease RusA